MAFTEEEIRNLELLFLNPQVSNIRLALAILENKEYPEAIRILLEEYQELHKTRIPKSVASIDQICFLTNNNKSIKIDRESREIGLFKKIIYLERMWLGSLPSFLSKMLYLEDLNLQYMNLSEVDFSILSSLKNLKKLNLYGCNITQLPVTISELTSLEILILGGNDLSKADFSPLISLKNLKILSLYSCSLTKLPTILNQLTFLETLVLGDNDLSKADLKPLIALKHLKSLNIEECDIWTNEQEAILRKLEKKGVEIKR